MQTGAPLVLGDRQGTLSKVVGEEVGEKNERADKRNNIKEDGG